MFQIKLPEHIGINKSANFEDVWIKMVGMTNLIRKGMTSLRKFIKIGENSNFRAF